MFLLVHGSCSIAAMAKTDSKNKSVLRGLCDYLALSGWLLLGLFGCGLASAGSAPNPVGMTNNGLRFLHGEGVPRDLDRALIYLCAAARGKQGAAAFELGWLYYRGRDLPRDDGLAAAWLREAERLGEQVPPRVQRDLAEVPPEPLRCRTRHGSDLPVADLRRVDFLIAIYELAPQFELDPGLVLEVVRAESNFDPKAVSHKGALGLMQLIPATARRFGVDDPLEPIQNLRGGMAYLSWLSKRFDGDLRLTLAGYNAGEGAVERHGGVPPYAETRRYVEKILGRYAASVARDSLI